MENVRNASIENKNQFFADGIHNLRPYRINKKIEIKICGTRGFRYAIQDIGAVIFNKVQNFLVHVFQG